MPASHLAFALVSAPADFGGAWTTGLSIFTLAGLAWLLTYALHSTLFLGSAWIATRRMATTRAGLRERVWKFAVLAAFVTASLQVGLGFEPLGGRLALRRAPAQAGPASVDDSFSVSSTPVELADLEASPLPEQPILWPALLVKDLVNRFADGSKPFPVAQGPDSAPAAPDAEPQDSESESSPQAEQDSPRFAATLGPWFAGNGEWTQWAFASCLLGALAGLLLFALLWVRLNGCLRDRVALEHGALAEKLRELCLRARISRRVRLSVAPSLGAPISMGMFRPEICVPPRVLLELNEEEQEVLLAHELAHVVRRDPLWLAVCRLCEGVFFFQPMNRVARREIEDCAEFLSDAWAVRQTGLRFSLASCLTRIAEWIVGERRALPAPAMAQGRSRLRHRVELLLDESAVKDVDRHPKWLGAACLAFGATLIAVVPCVSASEELLDIGDRAGLSFLPERHPELGAHADKLACEEQSVCDKKSKCETEACESSCTRASEAPAGDDLKSQLDALTADMKLLRSEAAALDLGHEFAPDLRELSDKLELCEMRLARVRELSARIEVLRASMKSDAKTTHPPVQAPSTATGLYVQPANHHTTPSTNLEEITK